MQKRSLLTFLFFPNHFSMHVCVCVVCVHVCVTILSHSWSPSAACGFPHTHLVCSIPHTSNFYFTDNFKQMR